MINRMKWISFAILFVFLAGFFRPVNAQTDDRTGSVTIEYPIDGVEFRLYCIGHSDEQGGCILDEPFASYQVDMTGDDAAANLAGYVNRDQTEITALSVKSTEKGAVSFSDLSAGVYLILGNVKTVDNVCYTPAPILVVIPDGEQEGAVLDVVIKDKWSELTLTQILVVKTWSGDTESSRPKSITVQLTKNGEAVDEKVLSKDTDWACEWSDLDASYSWDVLEKEVPKGYTVSYSKKAAGKVAITNTIPSNPPSTPNSKLPQTGQLWWPAVVLLMAGLVFILLGMIVRKRAIDLEEK